MNNYKNYIEINNNRISLEKLENDLMRIYLENELMRIYQVGFLDIQINFDRVVIDRYGQDIYIYKIDFIYNEDRNEEVYYSIEINNKEINSFDIEMKSVSYLNMIEIYGFKNIYEYLKEYYI